MFKPSRLHHSSCGDQCCAYMPETFKLLCWNVYKNNQKHPSFQHFLQKESQKRDLDFMLFQEAGFQDDHYFELPYFSFDGAANLEVRKKFYGVLTASRVESHDAKAYLSEETYRTNDTGRGFQYMEQDTYDETSSYCRGTFTRQGGF